MATAVAMGGGMMFVSDNLLPIISLHFHQSLLLYWLFRYHLKLELVFQYIQKNLPIYDIPFWFEAHCTDFTNCSFLHKMEIFTRLM